MKPWADMLHGNLSRNVSISIKETSHYFHRKKDEIIILIIICYRKKLICGVSQNKIK
jgi:hypothetical protein